MINTLESIRQYSQLLFVAPNGPIFILYGNFSYKHFQFQQSIMIFLKGQVVLERNNIIVVLNFCFSPLEHSLISKSIVNRNCIGIQVEACAYTCLHIQVRVICVHRQI